jgi:hypothetical protein
MAFSIGSQGGQGILPAFSFAPYAVRGPISKLKPADGVADKNNSCISSLEHRFTVNVQYEMETLTPLRSNEDCRLLRWTKQSMFALKS